MHCTPIILMIKYMNKMNGFQAIENSIKFPNIHKDFVIQLSFKEAILKMPVFIFL